MTSVFSVRRCAALALLGCASLFAAGGGVAAQGRVRIIDIISYEQLGAHVGKEVVVRTKLGSRRTGTLVRYTRTALRLRLGARDGGVELDIPSSSVRDIEVATETDTTPGVDSAQKN
ncbi:hypothetical protein [Tahibacter sp.]|uniref:hypothetical protein n=1 Tax=Tahibacter sp. TaxID=2056211 RepID=UPI0028C4796B|nr:hypothetical protein [Tahibacter sp.]